MSSTKRASILRSASLLLTLLTVSPAAAAVEPVDTFSIRAGGYISTFDTQVRADGRTNAGTSFDLERDFDLDPDNMIAVVGLNCDSAFSDRVMESMKSLLADVPQRGRAR